MMTGCYHKLTYLVSRQTRFGRHKLKCLMCFDIIKPSLVKHYFTNGEVYNGLPVFVKYVGKPKA